MSLWMILCDISVFNVSVETDCGSVDQHSGLLRGFTDRDTDRPGCVDTTLDDAFLLCRSPTPAANGLTCEIKNGISTINLSRPRADRLPIPLFNPDMAQPWRVCTPRKEDDVVPFGGESGKKSTAYEAAAAGNNERFLGSSMCGRCAAA